MRVGLLSQFEPCDHEVLSSVGSIASFDPVPADPTESLAHRGICGVMNCRHPDAEIGNKPQ